MVVVWAGSVVVVAVGVMVVVVVVSAANARAAVVEVVDDVVVVAVEAHGVDPSAVSAVACHRSALATTNNTGTSVSRRRARIWSQWLPYDVRPSFLQTGEKG